MENKTILFVFLSLFVLGVLGCQPEYKAPTNYIYVENDCHTEISKLDFETKVYKKTKEGYFLIGGIATRKEGGGAVCLQAMGK